MNHDKSTLPLVSNESYESENDSSWDEFRGEDVEPIGKEEFKSLSLHEIPADARILVMDDYFPESTIRRNGEFLICEVQEHLYTKYWEHKFSAYSFAEAMERAVKRLIVEGHPFGNPILNAEDVHIFFSWELKLPSDMKPDTVLESIESSFNLVWNRADKILENSDSVLILGKDTGPALVRLKSIAAKLEQLGYHTYIIKEQPDRLGEGIIQKVMRYALSSKFVLIENTAASGHLYEFPHVLKAAECITAVLQEDGKGATWMFEDAYAKYKHLQKVVYKDGELEDGVEKASAWAEDFFVEFADFQAANLPWLTK